MKVLAALAAVLTAFLLPAGADAAAGSLDRSFSGNGRLTVRTAPPQRSERFAITRLAPIRMASAPGPKGDLYATNGLRLLRYRADGRARRSFGGNGRVAIPVAAGTGFRLAGLEVDSRGRALVAGSVSPTPAPEPPRSSLVVYRFLPDGRLDRGFGKGGVATIAHSPLGDGALEATGLAIDSKERPVLTGFASGEAAACPGGFPPDRIVYPNRTFVLRLTSAGATDPTFGSAGFYAEPALEDPHLPALFGSGRVVFANLTEPRCPGDDIGAAPVLTELSIGGGFQRRFPIAADGGFEYVEALSLDVDRRNRIVVLYRRALGEGGGPLRLFVRRLLPGGAADLSFGDGGEARPQLPPGGAPAALVTDGRNRVILAGSTPRGQEARAFLALRLNAAGELQRWFGEDGWAITKFGRRAEVEAVAVHRDSSGRIVLSGLVAAPYLSTGHGLAFARYLSGGR